MKNMKKSIFWLSFTLLILALVSIGPDTPADDPSQTSQEPESSSAATDDDEPLETFEPTEKLSAESAVSFPVDI